MMARWIDRVLALFKWPTAILAVALLPGLIAGWLVLGDNVLRQWNSLLPFFLGLGGYAVVWVVLLRRWFMGNAFSTFEHELTHALFAWLTFHRVSDLRVTWKSGGHVLIHGQGNWLIMTAPYWTPTLALPIVPLFVLLPSAYAYWLGVAFGATIGYHVFSTWVETHSQQSDLRGVGLLFAAALLPAANLLALGLLVAFCFGGSAQAGWFLTSVFRASGEFWTIALAQLLNG